MKTPSLIASRLDGTTQETFASGASATDSDAPSRVFTVKPSPETASTVPRRRSIFGAACAPVTTANRLARTSVGNFVMSGPFPAAGIDATGGTWGGLGRGQP